MSFYSVFSSTRSSFHSPVYCDPVSRVPPVSSCEKQEKRGLGPGPGRVEDDDDSLPWSEQSGMHAAVHHQLMTTTAPRRRRMTMMIAYIIIINLYTYICWAQRSRSGRCRSRNQTLPWVWFGCWFVSGLPLKTGFVFIFFLCYCLRSHPRPCDPKRPPPHPHPTVARFSCRSVVLPCSASCLWRRGGWGWLAAGWGVMALQFTATDSQQNRLEDWSWNAITINKCRKDTMKRRGKWNFN